MSQKNLPGTSSFNTSLITYVNRIIIADTAFFVQEILANLHHTQNLTFAHFVTAWFKKMDLITSRESLRINLIAIYQLLPHFHPDLIAKHFQSIGVLTFNQLDNHMYLKLTNSSARFHSPSKMSKDNCTFPYGGSGALQ